MTIKELVSIDAKRLSYEEYQNLKKEFSICEKQYLNSWKERPLKRKKIAMLINKLNLLDDILNTRKFN